MKEETLVKKIISDLLHLTEDERMGVFRYFCVFCGTRNPVNELGEYCQCWNDE